MGDDAPSWAGTVVRAALASVPYVGGALEVVYSDVRARRAARADVLMGEIVGATGEEVLQSRLRDSPYVESVFVQGVDAALRTGIDAKRRLLARVVSAAVLDDAKVDEAMLVTDALSELDVPHVLALARLADEWAVRLAAPELAPRSGTSDVWGATPVPVQAALVRTGTAKPSPQMYTYSPEPRRAEGITDFGLMLVEQLRAEGLPDAP